MAKAAGALRQVGERCFQYEKVFDSGWGLTMTVVRLAGDDLLLYGPVWNGQPEVFEQIEALGRPRILVAPNHFHHMSVPRYRARYPEASLVASPEALPRLGRKGHVDLRVCADAQALLPADAHFLLPDGLKNGETWLSFDDGGQRTWLVGDAFFNVTRPAIGATGVALRLLNVSPALKLGRTFRWVGIRETESYRAFVRAAVERERPRKLGFCHGEPLVADDLGERLLAMI